MSQQPNPMYLFTLYEVKALTIIYANNVAPPKDENLFKLIDFRLKTTLGESGPSPTEILCADRDSCSSPEKTIYLAGFETTLVNPHHIHSDSSLEEKPGREGPFRTYFDGSYMNDLGHAVAICVDRNAELITTQCPKGKDFPDHAERILQEVYPEYNRVTLRAIQQTDAHSCLPLTLHNMFAMAGIHEAQESIDVMAWRSELLDSLEYYSVPQYPLPNNMVDFSMRKVQVAFAMNQEYGKPNPIFNKRYLP